jgi:hypothetical protein
MSMIINRDFDRQQMELLKKNIELFRKNYIGFFDFSENTYLIYRSINFLDNEIRKAFFEEILNIESIYAGIKDSGRDSFNEKEKDVIDKSIKKISDLVNYCLESCLKNYNFTVSGVAKIGDEKWLICPDCLDAWECISQDPMIICPYCDKMLHNPRYKK